MTFIFTIYIYIEIAVSAIVFFKPFLAQEGNGWGIREWRGGVYSTNYLSVAFSEEDNFFEIAEAVFVGWFTFEYVIRFIAAPHKLKY